MSFEPATHIYSPPLSSRASRQIPFRSRASLRGACVTKLHSDPLHRCITFESGVEKRFLDRLFLRTDIINVIEQPPAVNYRDRMGKHRKHTFDFLVTFECGRKVAVAVKPFKRAVATNFLETLQVIAQQLMPNFADEVVLVTDREVPKITSLNAARCHQFRRSNDKEADDQVATVICKMSGPTKIEDLVEHVGLFGRGYRAIIRAVGNGFLISANAELLDYSSVVSRGVL